MTAAPFTIGTQKTELHVDPAEVQAMFVRDRALIFDNPFARDTLSMLMARAAATTFVDDHVEQIGNREVEAPQRVGGMLSLILARQSFLEWIEKATGKRPVRAVVGRLVQTGREAAQELGWHNDLDRAHRLLGVVINLSDQELGGGAFELRELGSDAPFLSYRHETPGSMMVFPVDPALEHRVTQVTSGGPRRVYAGWFVSEPEHGGYLHGAS